MSNAYFQAAMSEYLAEEARAADLPQPMATFDGVPFYADVPQNCTPTTDPTEHPSFYGAAEGLVEQMFGHALEPDPDFSCNGIETDPGFYPGGPLVIEKSGADEAVRATLNQEARNFEDDFKFFLSEIESEHTRSVFRGLLDAGRFANFPKPKPAPDIASITRDIARGG